MQLENSSGLASRDFQLILASLAARYRTLQWNMKLTILIFSIENKDTRVASRRLRDSMSRQLGSVSSTEKLALPTIFTNTIAMHPVMASPHLPTPPLPTSKATSSAQASWTFTLQMLETSWVVRELEALVVAHPVITLT